MGNTLRHSIDFGTYVEKLGTRMFKRFGSAPAEDSDKIDLPWSNDHEPSDGINDAHIVISRGTDDYHYPVLDLDIDTMHLASSTEGHAHLYINKKMGWTQYVKLMQAMADAGILEQGYVHAAIDRGYSAVRLPWVRKQNQDLSLEERKNSGL